MSSYFESKRKQLGEKYGDLSKRKENLIKKQKEISEMLDYYYKNNGKMKEVGYDALNDHYIYEDLNYSKSIKEAENELKEISKRLEDIEKKLTAIKEEINEVNEIEEKIKEQEEYNNLPYEYTIKENDEIVTKRTSSYVIAARNNAKYRFFEMSKSRQIIAKVTGKWRKYKKLWDDSRWAEGSKELEYGEQFDKMFTNKKNKNKTSEMYEKAKEINTQNEKSRMTTGKYKYIAAGKVEYTNDPHIAARYNAQHRFFEMSKSRQIIAKMTGEWEKFRKLWSRSFATDSEKQRAANQLNNMFTNKGRKIK